MNHAPILLGISFGVPLLVAFFGAMAATIYHRGEAVNRPSRSIFIMFGVSVLLIVLLTMAAFSADIILFKAVLLLTGVFAATGVILGFRASRTVKIRSA